MKINAIFLTNVRCFRGENKIDFSEKINILIGHNNSGKSTILKSIYALQGTPFNQNDRSVLADGNFKIEIVISQELYFKLTKATKQPNMPYDDIRLTFNFNNTWEYNSYDENEYGITTYSLGTRSLYPDTIPGNLIFPFFSNRKIPLHAKNFGNINTQKITGTLETLPARVGDFKNPDKSYYSIFQNACKEILGYEVGTAETNDDTGKKYIAFIVDDDYHIPIESMGTGVANILGLIVDICTAENKIFLIEEPENDIHPKALKALLNLIEKKSDTNQFFISTHSNIVVSYLGGTGGTKIIQVKSETDYSKRPILPTSTIKVLSDSPQERIEVLEDMGYEMSDYGLWKGWLILEESSAEAIIRDFLIPNFVQRLLGNLKTYSAKGYQNVEDRLAIIEKLFVFIHLDPTYKNRAWVIIDSGEKETELIQIIKSKFMASGWNEKQFKQFSVHDFEDFYPSKFDSDKMAIKAVDLENLSRDNKKKKKKKLKEELLKKVKKWIEECPDEAKAEFSQSAQEVIQILHSIDESLNGPAK